MITNRPISNSSALTGLAVNAPGVVSTRNPTANTSACPTWVASTPA